MKKYILFDNDGVLVETERFYFLATQRALQERGVTLSFEYYQKIMAVAITPWHLMEEAGFSDNDIIKTRDQRNQYYQDYLNSESLYIEGVEEVIKALSKHYKMAIVTTSRRVDFEIIHKDKRLTQYMEFVLCEEDYPRAKPYPDPYLKALDLIGGTKEEAMIVEDSQRGVMAAFNAQIACVVVHNDFTASHDFSKASHKIKTISELIPLLNQNL